MTLLMQLLFGLFIAIGWALFFACWAVSWFFAYRLALSSWKGVREGQVVWAIVSFLLSLFFAWTVVGMVVSVLADHFYVFSYPANLRSGVQGGIVVAYVVLVIAIQGAAFRKAYKLARSGR